MKNVIENLIDDEVEEFDEINALFGPCPVNGLRCAGCADCLPPIEQWEVLCSDHSFEHKKAMIDALRCVDVLLAS